MRYRYLSDDGIELELVGVDNCLEVGLVLVVLGVEVEDDLGELRHLLAHLVMQFFAHRCS